MLNIKPWIGKDYEKPGIFPHRTLILGESNYTDTPEQFNVNLIINCVNDDLNGTDGTGFGKFATKLQRTIFFTDAGLSKREFWDNVAFFNFVDFRVGSKARERPTPEMWQNSISVFTEKIKTHKPERILILGKENWSNLTRNIENKPITPYATNISIDGQETIAGYINHPSSLGFKYDAWGPIAEELLRK